MPPDQALTDAYSIVVDVPRQIERDCPIFRPHSQPFDVVSGAIQDAARSLNLNPLDWKSQPKGLDFRQEIMSRTKSARLVVAVCSPDGSQGREGPNPNVMFEIGIATALGKPTLVLTSDPEAMPADIRGISSLRYEVSDAPRTLAALVQAEMSKMLRPDFPLPEGVWIARARHRMLLNGEFWGHFGVLLTYANAVRRQMDEISREFSRQLDERVNAILDTVGDDAFPALVAFQDAWTRCQRLQYSANPKLQPPPALSPAIKRLDELAQGTAAGSELQRVKKYLGMTKVYVECYRKGPAAVDQALQRLHDAPDPEQLEAFTKEVHTFVDAVNQATVFSGCLVDRIVELVADGFAEAPQMRARAAA